MPEERAAADELGRSWDALVRSGSVPDGEVDPAQAEALRRFHGLGTAPVPEGARARVWRNVLAEVDGPQRPPRDVPLPPTLPGRLRPTIGPNGRTAAIGAERPSRRLPSGRGSWALAQPATAALLVLTLVGSFVAFGWGRSDRREGPPGGLLGIVAPANGAPPAGVTAALLTEATFGPETAPAASTIEFYKATLDPGASVDLPPGVLCGCGTVDPARATGFEYVVAGGYRLRLDGPLRVRRAGEQRSTPTEEVPPATEIELGPGDTVLYPRYDAGGVFRNPGPEPLVLVGAAIYAAGPVGSSAWQPAPGLVFEPLSKLGPSEWAAAQGGPLRLSLHRVSLAPGAAVAAYAPFPELMFVESGALRLRFVKLGADPTTNGSGPRDLVTIEGRTLPFVPLGSGAKRVIENANDDEPLVFLVLTVTPLLEP